MRTVRCIPLLPVLLAAGLAACGGEEPPVRCNYVFTVGEPLCAWLASPDGLECRSFQFAPPAGCTVTACDCPARRWTCNYQIPTAVPSECLNVAQVLQCTAGGISPVTGLCQIFTCSCFSLGAAPPA